MSFLDPAIKSREDECRSRNNELYVLEGRLVALALLVIPLLDSGIQNVNYGFKQLKRSTNISDPLDPTVKSINFRGDECRSRNNELYALDGRLFAPALPVIPLLDSGIQNVSYGFKQLKFSINISEPLDPRLKLWGDELLKTNFGFRRIYVLGYSQCFIEGFIRL